MFALFITIQFTTSLNCEPSLYFLPIRVLKRTKSRSAWNTVRWFHLVPILCTIPLSRTRLARFFQAAVVPSEIFTRSRADLFNEFDAPLSRIPLVQSAAHSYELARKMKVYSMARDFFFFPRCSERFIELVPSLWKESGLVALCFAMRKKKSAFKFSARFERASLWPPFHIHACIFNTFGNTIPIEPCNKSLLSISIDI